MYGEKYSVWKFGIRALLIELDVITVIDGEIPEKLTNDWIKADKTARNIIVEYLSDSFLGFVQANNRARHVLNNLDAIYERKSIGT